MKLSWQNALAFLPLYGLDEITRLGVATSPWRDVLVASCDRNARKSPDGGIAIRGNRPRPWVNG
jgi:hypothetical protein